MSHAVDADITVAHTLPASFYRDEATWARTRERVFARTWQCIGDLGDVGRPCTLAPRELLPGLLDEPLLLARDAEGTLRCLSNVCTHRGNLLVTAPCSAEQIRCGYHSRRFDLAGRMTFMPEFREARHFPCEADHLAQVPLSTFGPLAFVAIDPVAPLDDFVGEIRQRLAWLPLDGLVPDPSRNRDYPVAAHWALYVENYLEGLHVPFVHPALNEVIDYGSYSSELFRYANLQLAPARGDEPAFEPPRGSPDEGMRVAAYYFWVFPNLMLNFYPWGLSLNLVQPQGPERCTVQFRSYVLDASRLGAGAGGALHEVEMEDEAVVQQVQRGLRSRFYRAGRYSPTRERGVHHFHRLLCEFLSEENDR